MTEIWQTPAVVLWTQYLLDSYESYLGKNLIPRQGNPLLEAETLFQVPWVVVSHNTKPEPILNYGNQIALELWEMSWSEFTQTPSRLTAEAVNQTKRQEILTAVQAQGYLTNYEGIRISRTGKRFLISECTIWNLKDQEGKPCGQAATFPRWDYL